jgi:hypothetical protein
MLQAKNYFGPLQQENKKKMVVAGRRLFPAQGAPVAG